MTIGYWIKGNNIIDISDTRHIIFVINNAKMFGLTKKEIEEIYEKHNEKLYSEGDAREEVIKEISLRGWVRVRHYDKPNYWSIQFHKYSKGVQSTVKNFVAWAMLDKKVMNKNDELRITGYEDGTNLIYDFMNGGAGKYLSENKDYDFSEIQLIEYTNVKKIKEIFYEILIESSLNRLITKMKSHDTGIITAWRDKEVDKEGIAHVYTYKERQQRNKSLLAKLMTLGYNVTSVRGVFIENFGKKDSKEVTENSFFVEDLKDRGTLKNHLISLGTEFDQDSVLFIPRITKKNNKGSSFLIGLKNDSFPEKGEEKEYPILKIGGNDYQFLTKVSGRPFYFTENFEILEADKSCSSSLGQMGMSLLANKNWEDLEV